MTPGGPAVPAPPRAGRPAAASGGRGLLPMLAGITAVGAFTLNIYLPARPAAQAAFRASGTMTGLTISLAGVSFACGLLAYGPWSDRLGRRPVLLAGLALFLVGTLLAMLAPSMPVLIGARVVQAFGSAAGVTVGRAIVRDLYPAERMARSLAYLTMVVSVANALAPTVGGLLTVHLGWRAVFGMLLACGTLISLWALRRLPETLDPASNPQPSRSTRSALTELAGNAQFLNCALQSSVVFASFMVFASYMPFVMNSAFGGNATSYGAWYLLIAGGYFLGNFTVTRYAARYGIRRLYHAGALLQFGAALLALGFALLHWWHPLAVFGPWLVLAYAQGLILPNVTAAAVSIVAGAADAAAGLLGFVQQLVAAAAVQAMAAAPTDTPVPVAVFVAVAAAVGVLNALTGTVAPRVPLPAGR